jgi:hypothetical protein
VKLKRGEFKVGENEGRCADKVRLLIFVKMRQWNSMFFYIFIHNRGRSRKGAAIYNATPVKLQQKIWFH